MNKAATQLSSNVIQGQVGVYRTAAELLRRQLIPYFPAADTGIDLVVNGCVRLQVKSTLRAKNNKWGRGHFHFTLKTSEHFRRHYRVPSRNRVFSQECDFVVCHAIEENRFWLLPAALVDGKPALIISVDSAAQWKQFDVSVAQALRQQGLSYRAIGAQMGVSWSTIQRRLEHADAKRPYSNAMEYENRWDQIIAALGLLNEATMLANPTERGIPTLSKQDVES